MVGNDKRKSENKLIENRNQDNIGIQAVEKGEESR